MLKLVACKSNSAQSLSSAGLLRQWLAMLCKIALMPRGQRECAQREFGLPLANVRAFKAATESSAKPCLQIRLNESDVQTV